MESKELHLEWKDCTTFAGKSGTKQCIIKLANEKMNRSFQ